MASDNLVLQRYAKAAYALAVTAGETDRVGTDFRTFSETVRENDALRKHLGSPELSKDGKARLCTAVMGAEVSDLARKTVLLLIGRGRSGSLANLVDAWEQIAADAEGRLTAQVQSAEVLSDEARSKLLSELEKLTGKSITLEESVHAELLGGVKIVFGSKMIDGSLVRRMEQLGEKLARVPLAVGN